MDGQQQQQQKKKKNKNTAAAAVEIDSSQCLWYSTSGNMV